MKQIQIQNFHDYLGIIEKLSLLSKFFILYRAQNVKEPLIPAITRKDPTKDTSTIEMEMIAELKRRTETMLNRSAKDNWDDWDWLVFAQHYGLKTRLLDWTSNPLTALWFACKDQSRIHNDSYVYLLLAQTSFILDKKKNPSPWSTAITKILKPSLNNERIIAQAGWFTAHRYSSLGSFVSLERMKQFQDRVIELIIPAKEKRGMLKQLNIFGINHQSLFPDVEGVCRQINWEKEF